MRVCSCLRMEGKGCVCTYRVAAVWSVAVSCDVLCFSVSLSLLQSS